MNKNVARFIAGPLVAAGMAAGAALGLAAAANADDPGANGAGPFSAHSGVIFANAHFISEPDRAANPAAGIAKLQKGLRPPTTHTPEVHHAR